MSSYLESFSKWIQLKIYQLEVTFSVYIFTPIEKFIFCTFPFPPFPFPTRLVPSWELTACNNQKKTTDSVLFLLVGLTFIATVLYLPHHLQFIVNRAWFYMHGDGYDVGGAQGLLSTTTAAAATTALGKLADATASVVREL